MNARDREDWIHGIAAFAGLSALLCFLAQMGWLG